MKAAFAAGAAYELAEGLGIKKFDIIMSMSSSGPTLTYFTSEQFSTIKDVWENELGRLEFVKKMNIFTGKPIFNLDYLIGDIFGRKYPLDITKFKETPTRLFIPVYNYLTEKVEYFSNKQSEVDLDVCHALRATMAIHPEQIVQKENLGPFIDPALVSPLVYERAITEGATHFLVVSNHQGLEWTIKKMLGFQLFKLFQSRNFPKNVKRKLKEYPKSIKHEIEHFKEFCQNYNVLFIQPPIASKVRTVMVTNKQVKGAVEYGREIMQKAKDNQLIEVFRQRSKELCQ